MVIDYHIADPTLDREDFTLSDAEAITSFRRSDLHNHIKRGILQYLGQGGAGRKRQFSVLGLYECGVVEALVQSGLTLLEAAHVVHWSLSLARGFALCALRSAGSTQERAENAIQEQPKRLLCHEWSSEARSRDLSSPYLWLFVLDEVKGARLEVAKGWPDIARAARNLICRSYPGYVLRDRWDAPEFLVPEDFIQTARPHLHIFNVTAVLSKLDRVIIETLPPN